MNGRYSSCDERERKKERETERDTERWTTKEHGTISTPLINEGTPIASSECKKG